MNVTNILLPLKLQRLQCLFLYEKYKKILLHHIRLKPKTAPGDGKIHRPTPVAVKNRKKKKIL
jgi:hypothetical protein